MAWGYGLKAENHKNGGLYITDIDNNEYLCVRGVDFGKKGAKKFSVSAGTKDAEKALESKLPKYYCHLHNSNPNKYKTDPSYDNQEPDVPDEPAEEPEDPIEPENPNQPTEQ